MSEIKKMGILGGTFDPIHYGHLVAADCACDACGLDQVLFVISARPPHKDRDEVLDCRYRCEMVQIAIQDNPAFELSMMEVERQGLSYTVETIAAYLEQFPGVEISFIMGVDSLMLMNTWKDVERLAQLCHFIVVTRPGYELRRSDECYRGLPALLWEKITVIPIPGLFISSSEIRQRVAQGKTIKYLLPARVEQYIHDHDLYLDGEETYA